MMDSIKSYWGKEKGSEIKVSGCPGDYGLDCPVKYHTGLSCPKKSSDCWGEPVSDDNKDYIKEFAKGGKE